MWRTEKFGAVSSQGQQATRCASIFLNPEGIRYSVNPAWIHPGHRRREHWRRAMHSVSDEPFISSGFGAEPRPSYVPLLRKCGKLNRQTPAYRNHSKSQKTNNRDLLKSPKNQILQHQNLPASGLTLTLENQLFLPFLPGSASRVEITVTYSKQRTARILPGSRIARKRSSNQSKFTPDSVRGTRVAVHGSRLLLTAAFRYNAPGPNFSREARNLT
jgi:hypothetical protein